MQSSILLPQGKIRSSLSEERLSSQTLVTLVNPPGIKTFSSIQMQTPNPPIGLVYIAAVIREAGVRCTVIDGVGAKPWTSHALSQRSDQMIQGLSYDQIVDRIPADIDIIGLTCMFSTLLPITREIAIRARKKFPDKLIVLGGEHATAVPDVTLRSSPVDLICLGDGLDTALSVIEGYRGDPAHRDH
jgi:anaerobic magnesium-protoporphyrin IX monomethyl ester cyclase